MQIESPVVKHLDNYIVESLEREKDLRPLLLFHGGVTEHRARSAFAMLRFFRDNEIEKPLHGQQFISSLPNERHKTGIHAKTMDSTSIIRWICRLRQCPSVFDIDKPLKEYVDWVWENTTSFMKYIELRMISETAYRSRRNWRVIQSLGAPTELYPFLPKNQTVEIPMLAAAHAVVPKWLPEDVRADVCQDLIVSILLGEASMGDLESHVAKHLKTHRYLYGDRWGAQQGIKVVSMEKPLGWVDEAFTIKDTLRD